MLTLEAVMPGGSTNTGGPTTGNEQERPSSSPDQVTSETETNNYDFKGLPCDMYIGKPGGLSAGETGGNGYLCWRTVHANDRKFFSPFLQADHYWTALHHAKLLNFPNRNLQTDQQF